MIDRSQPLIAIGSGNGGVRRVRAGSIAAPLLAAIICTILIAEAIHTALNSRANGDVMEIACPLLGAIFLSIPAAQAWWATIKMIRKSKAQ
jgi:hypothetical protein